MVRGTGAGGLDALHLEVLGEERGVLVVLVEVVRGEHDRDDRHVGVELHPHQAVDDGFGHELVAVDAAVDDEAGPDDGAVAAACAARRWAWRGISNDPGTAVEVDLVPGHAEGGDLREERVPAAVDDLLVPRGLHERQAQRRAALP